MSTAPKTLVVMNLDARNVPATLGLAKAVYAGVSGSPTLFPSPPIAMAIFADQIQGVDAAEQTARSTRAAGTAAIRNDKRDVLVTSLGLIRGYVQGLCNASPEQAGTLIAAAGMRPAKRRTRNKPLLAAKPGVSGEIVLEANRTLLCGGTRKHVVFGWQSSVDGGKTWIDAPPTGLCTTTFTGLTPLTVVWFRVSAMISTTQGDWSQAITVVVH